MRTSVAMPVLEQVPATRLYSAIRLEKIASARREHSPSLIRLKWFRVISLIRSLTTWTFGSMADADSSLRSEKAFSASFRISRINSCRISSSFLQASEKPVLFSDSFEAMLAILTA